MRLIVMLMALILPLPALAQPLRAMIAPYAATHDFSGTILVTERGRRLYSGSFGLADRAFAVPATLDTRYRIASVTKLFTAALVLQLRDEGKLDVTKAIDAYLPDYPGEGASRITLHQLLDHTSGIAQFDTIGSYQEAFAAGIAQYQRPMTLAALIAHCCSGKLTATPGTAFVYNNADYLVLAAILERVTGRSYEALLRERILVPLRLAGTGLLHWDAIVPRLAPTYFFRDDSKTLIADMPVYFDNWSAAGAMYSTAPDLARFADALYGGELVSPASLDLLLAPGLDDYGYGLWSYAITRGGRIYHVAKRPGSIMGANAVLYRLRERGLTIVLLANTNRADLDIFAQKIANVFIGEPPSRRK